MAVKSALQAGRPLPPKKFLVLISITGQVDARTIVRLVGLGQVGISSAITGNRNRDLPACSKVLNQLRYRVPQRLFVIYVYIYIKYIPLGFTV
jgi:hypothetical protein